MAWFLWFPWCQSMGIPEMWEELGGNWFFIYLRLGWFGGRCDKQNNLPWWLIHHCILFLYHHIVIGFEMQSPAAHVSEPAPTSGGWSRRSHSLSPLCCSEYITLTKQFQPKKKMGGLAWCLSSTAQECHKPSPWGDFCWAHSYSWVHPRVGAEGLEWPTKGTWI